MPTVRKDITIWQGLSYFDNLNRLGVAHECDRQTDGQVAFGNSAL